HNGTIKGEYSWFVGHANDLNPSDRAVHFRRGRGRIVVDDNDILRPRRAVSVSAWVYFSEKQDGCVVVKGAEDKETYKMEVDDWDELKFKVRDVCNAQWDAEPDDMTDKEKKSYKLKGLGYDIVYPHDWVHLAGTFDGDTNTVRAYVNAVLIDEANDANFVNDGNDLSQDTNDLGIGGRPEELDDTFKGAIDEVRIYNYALDANEIAWLATDGTGYRRLRSQVNLYDLEEEGYKSVNFRDLAVLIDEHWLDVILWP
ncbi:MAG: LamG domain-containing protein, partial [Planctomycetota bacterium]